MHISAINAPSDKYGAVSDVARPLIHKLNQASMSGSTYDALRTILVWGLEQLEGNIKKDLDVFTGSVYVAEDNRATESTQDASSEPVQWHDIANGSKPATGAENASAEDSAQKEPSEPAQNTETEGKSDVPTAVVEGIEVKVLTLSMLGEDEQEETVADAVVTDAPAPVAEAPKVVTNPAVKAKAK